MGGTAATEVWIAQIRLVQTLRPRQCFTFAGEKVFTISHEYLAWMIPTLEHGTGPQSRSCRTWQPTGRSQLRQTS